MSVMSFQRCSVLLQVSDCALYTRPLLTHVVQLDSPLSEIPHTGHNQPSEDDEISRDVVVWA